MEKLKKIIIIIGILLAVLIIAIIAIDKNKNVEEEFYEIPFDLGDPIDEKIGLTFKEYSIISNCLQTYVDILNTENSSYYGRNENNEYVKIIEEEEIKNRIYELLSKDYIDKNKITVENLYEYVDTTKEKKITTVLEIYKKEENLDVISYAVKGLNSLTNNKSNSNEMYLIINVDYKNKTFSVEPLNESVSLEGIKIVNKQESIKKNNNNQYYETEITKETIVKEYFTIYKNIILSRPDIAYEHLNEEYKVKRFPTLQSFKEYINKNKTILEKARIGGYDVVTEETNQYICEDQFKNIYIFNENKVLDYNVILDAYTIELPQFIEKYESSNTQTRVLLNIEKIKQALNSGDYTYVYSKLADSFKNNKYKTEQEFESDIKDALYNNIEIEYEKFSNEGETYIYDLKIKNLENKEDEVINMQIIMQLKEEREFVMSFSIK